MPGNKPIDSTILLSQIAQDVSKVANQSAQTSTEIANIQGLLKGWQIPEFKTEVFKRLHTVESKVDRMNGDKIEKIADKVEALEARPTNHDCTQTEKITTLWETHVEKRGMVRLILTIGAVVSGSGAAGFGIERLLNYLFGGAK